MGGKPRDPTEHEALPLADDREPWERQPHESDLDYDCFLVWRDLPYVEGYDTPRPRFSDRTVANAYLAAADLGLYKPPSEKMRAKEHAGSHRPTYDRRLKFRWVERAEAYDRELERERLEERKRLVAANEHRFVDMSHKMIEIVLGELRKLEQLTQADLENGNLRSRVPAKTLASLARSAVGLSRAGIGEADEKIEINGKLTYADLVKLNSKPAP